MMPLHDSTRRRVSLALFLAFGVLPLVVALVVGLSRKLPMHTWAEEERLSQALGLDISIDRVKHPRPNVVNYQGVIASDPETGQELFRTPLIQMTRGGSTTAEGERPVDWILSCEEIVLRTARADSMHPTLEFLFTRRVPWNDLAVRFQFDKITLSPPDDPARESRLPETLHGLRGRCDWRLEETSVNGCFDLLPRTAESGDPIRVRVARRREDSATTPVTLVELRADGDALPCSLLALVGDLAPNIESSAVEFQGTFTGELSADGWNGQVDGRLTLPNVGHELSDQSSRAITAAEAAFELKGRFTRSRMTEVSGAIDLTRGEIGRDLAYAWAQRFDLTVTTSAYDVRPTLPFERLNVRYTIRGDRLYLEAPHRVLATSHDGQSVLLQAHSPVAGPVELSTAIGDMIPRDADGERFPIWAARFLDRFTPLPRAAAPPTPPELQPYPRVANLPR